MPQVLEITDHPLADVLAQVEEEEEEELLQAVAPAGPEKSMGTGVPGGAQQANTGMPGGGTGQEGGGGGDDGADDPSENTGPQGEGDYVVQDGDCISSIAKNSGHFWETIWNDPGNSQLKTQRRDPNVLLPGDRVTIPELRPKEEDGATEEHHRFRRKGEPAKLRLRLMEESEPEQEDEDEQQQPQAQVGDADTFVGSDSEEEHHFGEDKPRANVPYDLIIDGERHTGSTDEDGRIEVPMSGNKRRGKLILNPGTEEEEEFALQLGHISPVSELSGVKQRLTNLTFDCGDVSDEMTAGLETALRAFQQKYDLPVTGEPDQATRDKLVEVHGC